MIVATPIIMCHKGVALLQSHRGKRAKKESQRNIESEKNDNG
jgi:hypothetical protein